MVPLQKLVVLVKNYFPEETGLLNTRLHTLQRRLDSRGRDLSMIKTEHNKGRLDLDVYSPYF